MIFPKDIDLMDYADEAAVRAAWGEPVFDSDCKLFLNFKGANDAQPTDADKSETPHTLTYVGDMDLDDSHGDPIDGELGTAVYAPDRVDNYVRILGDTSDWSLTGDFTIEGWHYLPDAGGGYDAFLTQDSYPWGFWTYNNIPAFYDGSWHQSGPSFPLNQWVHWCVMRSGTGTNNIKIYINGVKNLEWTNTGTFGQNAALAYGWGWGGQSGVDEFYGWGNKVRVTNGRAIYNPAGFTPPSFMTSYETGATLAPGKRFGTSAVRLEFGDGASDPTVGRSVSLDLSGYKRIQGLIKCNRSDAEIIFELFDPNNELNPTTKLLLHFDGTDGDTTSTDSSYSNHSLTFVGNTQLDDAQAKFGDTSCYFDGSGDYITISDTADWNFGTEPFTIEFWYKPVSYPGHANIIGTRADYSNHGWWFGVFSDGRLNFDGQAFSQITSTAGDVSGNDWQHICVSRYGTGTNETLFFVDGQIVKTATISGSITNADGLYIGAVGNGNEPMTGWLDEIRITKGEAKYTEAFTPATSPYVDVLGNPIPVNITRVNEWAVLDIDISHIPDIDKANIFKIQFKVDDTASATSIDLDHLQAVGHRMWLDKFSYGTTAIFDTFWTTNFGTVTVETGGKRDEYSSIKFVTVYPLIGHWKCNENNATSTVEDFSGKGHHGEASVATSTLADTGKISGCFNLANTYTVDFGAHADFEMGDGTTDIPFSVACWYYHVDDAGAQTIIAYSGASIVWNTYVTNTENVRIYVRDTSAGVACYSGTANSTVVNGNWYHLVFTYDGRGGASAGDGMQIYINGTAMTMTPVNNASYVAMEQGVATALLIGNLVVAGWEVQGKVDDVRLYRDKVLNQTEVDTLYNSGSGTETTALFSSDVPYISKQFDNPLDLTNMNFIAGKIRASNIGENFKLRLFDGTIAGEVYTGTWHEKNINIQRPDEWQNWVWDIRGEDVMTSVAEMRIESINSNIENTVYLNDFEARMNALSFLEAV